MEQEKFSSQCDMTKITKNSLLRALSIDGPIGVGVVCFKDPNVPKIGAYLLTSVAAFFSYFARSTAKECIANLTNEETY